MTLGFAFILYSMLNTVLTYTFFLSYAFIINYSSEINVTTHCDGLRRRTYLTFDLQDVAMKIQPHF